MFAWPVPRVPPLNMGSGKWKRVLSVVERDTGNRKQEMSGNWLQRHRQSCPHRRCSVRWYLNEWRLEDNHGRSRSCSQVKGGASDVSPLPLSCQSESLLIFREHFVWKKKTIVSQMMCFCYSNSADMFSEVLRPDSGGIGSVITVYQYGGNHLQWKPVPRMVERHISSVPEKPTRLNLSWNNF